MQYIAIIVLEHRNCSVCIVIAVFFVLIAGLRCSLQYYGNDVSFKV